MKKPAEKVQRAGKERLVWEGYGIVSKEDNTLCTREGLIMGQPLLDLDESYIKAQCGRGGRVVKLRIVEVK